MLFSNKPMDTAVKSTSSSKMGTISGKLKIAISVELLLAFTAIAEMKVKLIENPRLPNTSASENTSGFKMGLIVIKLIAPQVKKLSASNKITLYIIFDSIMAIGLAKL